MRRLLLASLLAAACGPTNSYWYTSSRRAPSKPDGCRFRVVTTTPNVALEEIGVLDYPNPAIVDAPTHIRKFKRAVAAQVCRAGGDIVIALANGKGEYIKGTVLRYTKPPAAQPAAMPAAAPAPEAAPSEVAPAHEAAPAAEATAAPSEPASP